MLEMFVWWSVGLKIRTLGGGLWQGLEGKSLHLFLFFFSPDNDLRALEMLIIDKNCNFIEFNLVPWAFGCSRYVFLVPNISQKEEEEGEEVELVYSKCV